jgi:alpha-galactosidase
MHLLDSIFSDMYLNLSISPIFPAQYAQSRRIACDAWNKIKDTEYTMNALSYGWWIDGVYQYNDADHVVLRDATEGENRARITSSVITGLYITGDDFSADSMAIARARLYLTNPDINRLATGRSFRPLLGNDERSEHVFVRTEADGTIHLAVFNYTDQPSVFRFDKQLIPLDGAKTYTVEELWSHKKVGIDDVQTIPSKDVKVFRIKAV